MHEYTVSQWKSLPVIAMQQITKPFTINMPLTFSTTMWFLKKCPVKLMIYIATSPNHIIMLTFVTSCLVRGAQFVVHTLWGGVITRETFRTFDHYMCVCAWGGGRGALEGKHLKVEMKPSDILHTLLKQDTCFGCYCISTASLTEAVFISHWEETVHCYGVADVGWQSCCFIWAAASAVSLDRTVWCAFTAGTYPVAQGRSWCSPRNSDAGECCALNNNFSAARESCVFMFYK